jgi:Cu/Zn superoxide dismutase
LRSEREEDLVKKLVAGAFAGALLLALTLAGAAVARTQAASIQLSAAMVAAQEVPTPTGDVGAARGTFTATVTKSDTGAVVAWEMTFTGLTGPAVAAHIHKAARGVAGGVMVPLCSPCQSPASGEANVDIAGLEALQTGGAYANIHTPTNGAGEIRGQIGVRATVTTTLTSRQEVPKPTGNVRRAKGTFTASVTKTGTTGTLAWRLTFRELSGRALAAHIHIGQRGKAGPVAVTLCGPCRSGVRKSVALSVEVLAALEAGRAYVNVHTPRNQAGEIRGQIRRVPLTIT